MTETEQLYALIRKVKSGVRWWASLSYIDGQRGQGSSWNEQEQELLRKVFNEH
jgi:hypothetical protein